MTVSGTVRDRVIVPDEPLPFAEGTRVELEVTPQEKPPKGSAQALLRLAGTLTDEEAEAILQAAQQCRKVDWGMWQDKA